MQITKKNLSDTKLQLKIVVDSEMLARVKDATLREFARTMKLPGFREGKAPLAIVEKNADPNRLQSEFVKQAVNDSYLEVLRTEKLRPVAQPEVTVTKFVPLDALEYEATVEVVGEVKLPDYKKIKLAKAKVSVEAKDVDEVIAGLKTREAEKKDVDRASKQGDQVWIDFKGVDAKSGEPIKGADGKDYPLVLGSNTFIPGFEPELVGLKAGDEKTFTITFPKDYSVKTLQNRKVTFSITANKVQEVVEPKLDDAFAAKVGPFKTMAELKADIKKELLARKEGENDQKYADDLVLKVAEKAKVAIPEALVEEQIDLIERDRRQGLMYRGQTWQEFLESEGHKDDKSWRDAQRSIAEMRVKAGLVLSQIADEENLSVSAKELEEQLAALKVRYPDPGMQAELAKPEARNDIATRMLVEKTVAKLVDYANK